MPNCNAPLDHIVIVVGDLRAAIKEYESQGFTVNPGGRNGPTHNALIAFSDGTYIELITPRNLISKVILRAMNWLSVVRPKPGNAANIKPRLLRWFDGRTGFRDWCLRVETLNNVNCLLADAGIPCTDISQFRRVKPNGEQVRWCLMAPLALDLPFLIEDITDRAVRIPSGPDVSHALGVLGIEEIHFPDEQFALDIPALLPILSAQMASEAPQNAEVTVSTKPLPSNECQIILKASSNKSRAIRIQSNGYPLLVDAWKQSGV